MKDLFGKIVREISIFNVLVLIKNYLVMRDPTNHQIRNSSDRGDDFNFKAETYQCGGNTKEFKHITKENNDLMGLNQKTLMRL